MWFSAAILLRSEAADRTPRDLLWEESIVLVKANTEEDAIKIATAIGRRQETSYRVEGGAELRWLFDRVERVFAIEADDLQSGTELFSRLLRASEVESLLTPFNE
ncbi:MAG: DUF4288 domain-containing protein [Pirellulales bacterium]